MFVEFLNQGLSVIPLNGKRPVISGWQRYNESLPSPLIAKLWDDIYRGYNVGLCVGPASGIMAVDIDTDDIRVHSIVPPSPLRRVGRPGREVRFYRYNQKIESIKDHAKKIEIFSRTGQVVIPPSIHPDTKQNYFWSGDVTFETPNWRDSLPEMENIDWMSECPILASQVVGGGGRNTSLTKLVCAMLGRGESIERTINEALKYDQTMHGANPYFCDLSEPEAKRSMGDAREAAKIFVERHHRQLKGKGMIGQPIVEFKPKHDFPRAPGIMGEIYYDIIKYSRVEQPPLAYGGALAVMSVCALGRYSWNGVWPNLFIMNIAPSGGGKGIVYDYIKDLLSHEKLCLENLIGQSSWSSNVSMSIDFPEQRYRLDLMDEFGRFIREASKGDTYKESAMYLANELFSINGRRFLGSKSIKRGDKTGECFGPGLSILASVQPDIFTMFCTREMFDSGFFNRFIYFIAEDRPVNKGYLRINVDSIADKLSRTILSRNCFDLSSGDSIKNMRPNCLELESAPGALEYFNEITPEMDELEKESGIRCIEISMKLALLSALASERHIVVNDDIDYALSFVRAMIERSKLILREAKSGTPFGKAQEMVIRWLRSRSDGHTTTVDYANFMRDFPMRERKDILQSLTDRGIIYIDGPFIRLNNHDV